MQPIAHCDTPLYVLGKQIFNQQWLKMYGMVKMSSLTNLRKHGFVSINFIKKDGHADRLSRNKPEQPFNVL